MKSPIFYHFCHTKIAILYDRLILCFQWNIKISKYKWTKKVENKQINKTLLLVVSFAQSRGPCAAGADCMSKAPDFGGSLQEQDLYVKEGEMAPGNRQCNRIVTKFPSEPPCVTFFSSCWNLVPLCPNVGDILMHWLLGDVRMLSKQDKHDKCLPFWRENIFIKAIYTSYIHPQIFVAQVTERNIPSHPTSWFGCSQMHPQSSHKTQWNQEPIHKEKPAPGLIQASHSSS